MIEKNVKISTIICLISLFIVCVVEKFFYPNAIFDFKRAMLCFLNFLIFITILFKMIPIKYQNKIFRIINFSFKCIFNINNLYIIKILFSLIITIYAGLFLKDIYYIIFGFCEIFIIVLISNIVLFKYKRFGRFINNVLMLLYNTNMVVLIFGGSFITSIMLSNLNSIEDLKGKMFLYIIGIILVLLFSFLPFNRINITKRNNYVYLFEIFLYEFLIILILGTSYSSFFNYINLTYQEYRYIKLQNYLKNNSYDKERFYKKQVDDYIRYDNSVTSNPNVILIFTEGLSKNVIDDDRNIMPNIKKYFNKSISFTGYYNHTAATYRGIIGGLYSGYQFNNTDENHLISIQSILKDNGYYTEFLNSEPNNNDFTKYLESFKFDNVVTGENFNGMVNSISDKNIYELLFDNAILLNKKKTPFFISTYTFGTHVSFDSIDKKYLDGSDRFLNKFYDLDYQFGNFMNKFINSELYENTIIVFTTDHASYTDYDYLKVFGDTYPRKFTFVDEIPLFIYHKDIKSKVYNVNGRNSLDLAPTILDYIDISGSNYFLGKSLFSFDNQGTKFDTIYTETTFFISTDNKELKEVDRYDEVIYDINGYLSISSK